MPVRRPPRLQGKERILAAAIPLFAERGFQATSMRTIASQARCDVALAYHHFGSKEALYEAIIADYSTRYAGLFGLLARPGTAAQRVGWLVDGVIDFMRDNLPFVKLLLRETMSPSKVYVRTMQKNMRVLLSLGEEAVRDGVRRNKIAKVAPREFLLLAYGAVTYYMIASDSLTTLFGEPALEGAALERFRGEAKALLGARLGLESITSGT